MAIDESDREDLMFEVRGLTPRIEYVASGEDVSFPTPVVIGRRRDDGLSLYIGTAPVWHFDSDLRLRRAFVDGKLLRTAGNTLSELTKKRTANRVLLERRDLPETECRAMLQRCRSTITEVLGAIESDDLKEARIVEAAEGNAEEIFLSDLKSLSAEPVVLAKAIAGRG